MDGYDFLDRCDIFICRLNIRYVSLLAFVYKRICHVHNVHKMQKVSIAYIYMCIAHVYIYAMLTFCIFALFYVHFCLCFCQNKLILIPIPIYIYT